MYKNVWRLLAAIELEMSRLDCWQSCAPGQERLLSEVPFCIDTLSFLEWLQWIYVARLRVIIEAGTQLPKGANIYDYAELALSPELKDSSDLLALIRQLDIEMAK